MSHIIANLVSLALDVPSWAPRAVKRIAGLLIVGTLLLAPDVFRAGMQSWVQHQTQVILARITPLLQPAVPVHLSDTETSPGSP